jgi:hypothetical protein
MITASEDLFSTVSAKLRAFHYRQPLMKKTIALFCLALTLCLSMPVSSTATGTPGTAWGDGAQSEVAKWFQRIITSTSAPFFDLGCWIGGEDCSK